MSLFTRSAHGELNGFLDAGSHLEGELRFEQTFRIEGKLTGTVRSEGDLIVGPKGEVESTVEVGRIVVTGEVRGTVRAARRVEIGPGGKLLGDLETPTLVIEDGGLFEGRCQMQRAAEAKIALVPPPTVAQPERRGKAS